MSFEAIQYDIKDGIVITGEDLRFENYRGLARMLILAAANGTPVLCLAPKNGVLPIPEIGDDEYFGIKAMSFQKNDVIRKLNPKPERVICVHGEEKNCTGLAKTLSHQSKVEGLAPRNLDSIRLK